MFSVLFLYILSLRGDSLLNINQSVLPEYLSFGYQNMKWKYFLFFVPGFLKGDWINTNVILSELVAPGGNLFFVITFGDFINHFYGYGYFWFITLIFSLFIYKIFSMIFQSYFKGHFLYWLVLVALIGGRVGLETFIPFIFGSFVIPIIFHELICRLLLNSKK